MQVTFIIDGQPQGKGRPRFNGKTGRTYTPDKTVIYENLVKLAYKQQCKGMFFEKGVPLAMEIMAFYKMPQASKKKTVQMASGEIRPMTKPDIDNIVKVIADSLNGIAYHDDSQIVACVINKYYSDTPRVCVKIGGVTGWN